MPAKSSPADIAKTIAALSPSQRALLSQRLKERKDGDSESRAIRPRADAGHAPLSFAQQRLWFIDQFEPGSALYNIPLAVRLGGRLSLPALRRTFDEIVRRHEVLRTTFEARDGEPVQVIQEPRPLPLAAEDLSRLPAAERDEEVRRLAHEEAARPFDLAAGPLLRVRLLRLSEEEHVVLLTMHHIVSDAWSLGLLVKEVGALYEAFSGGRRSPLEELPIQYADFAAWQREWLQGEVLERQLFYWREQLKDLSVVELTTDHPRLAARSYRGATEAFRLDAELSRELREVAQREGVTLFMLLLAVFDVLLWRYTGREDLSVGTNIANRNRGETEVIIGFFVNNLVLRTSLAGNPSFRELLGRVRDVTLNAYMHQDLPFEKIVEALRPERRLNRAPLFQVVFTLQNVSLPELRLPGLTISQIEVHNRKAKYDMVFNLSDAGEHLYVNVEYSSELFDAVTVKRMLRHFEGLLRSAAARTDDPIEALEMLSDEEGDFFQNPIRVTDLEGDFSFGG